MRESTVTIKGQTTLPRDVRSALGLMSGDRVRYVILDGEVRIVKACSVKDLKGLLARPDRTPISLDAMDEAVADAAIDGAAPKR